MKKTLALILVAVMLLSTLVALVVPAAAAEEGDWAVYLTASAKDSDEPEKVPPLPGYYYDENGFHTKSPNYTNYNPKFSIVSKEQFNIQNFSMTVVVHDYCITGDNWLSFSLWSESNGIAQGDTSGKYGDGWTSLIRQDTTTGALNRFESWNATIGGRQNKQQFSAIDGTQTAPVILDEVLNDDGDRVYTFAIEDGIVKVNGKTVGAGTDKVIADRFDEGLAYVGVTIHNTDATGTYQPTMSIIECNGDVPTGTDNAEPENKERRYGPMIDSNTVPYGQPAVWFDTTGDATNGTSLPQHSACDIGYADDNESFKITAEYEAFYMQWNVPDEITYEARDFTYMLYIFKNYCSCALAEEETALDCVGNELCSVRYCAGTVTSPDNVCHQAVPAIIDVTPVDAEGNRTGEDLYSVVLVKIENDLYVERIHGFRLDVGGFANYGVDGRNTFDIMGCGLFRAAGEAIDYVSNFRDLGLDTTGLTLMYHDCAVDGHIDSDGDTYCDVCWEEYTGAPACDHVDEDADELCDNCGADMSAPATEPSTDDATTEAPAGETTEETTDKPTESTTAAKKPSNNDDDEEEEDKKGCGSVVSMGALAIVSILGTGLVVKRKEN